MLQLHDPYIRSRRVALGRWALDRRRVCLDTNFWIGLRKVALGRQEREEFKVLDCVIRHAVSTGLVVCPLAPAVFVELMTQEDANTRAVMASVIDELSCGIALQSDVTHRFLQLQNLLTGGNRAYQVEGWTRISYPLGDIFPYEGSTNQIRESDDRMWRRTLSELVKDLGTEIVAAAAKQQATATRINADNLAHAGEHASYAQILEAELQGLLESLARDSDELEHALRYRALCEGRPDPSPRELKSGAQQLATALSQAIASGKLREQLPELYVRAVLHADVRWSKTKKLTRNDLWDFENATTALGFCSALFTDKSLAHRIRSRKLDAEYGVTVTADIEKAIAYVQGVSAAQDYAPE